MYHVKTVTPAGKEQEYEFESIQEAEQFMKDCEDKSFTWIELFNNNGVCLKSYSI